MTYSESAKGVSITKARALKELESHGIFHDDDFALFFKEVGDKADYQATDVLAWLGY